MNPIKVAIAEDHRIFRKGIMHSLQYFHHLHFVAEAGNGKELIAQLTGHDLPEVILMDLRMPVMDGIETTQYLKKIFPFIHIICLTMADDQQMVKRMMEFGACGYLLKNADPLVIKNAIEEAASSGYTDLTFPDEPTAGRQIPE